MPRKAQDLFESLKTKAATFGRELTEKAFILLYAFQDERTPAWARATILAALAYLIMPLDACPDPIPVAGLADDLTALLGAVATISGIIEPDHIRRARATSREIFGV